MVNFLTTTGATGADPAGLGGSTLIMLLLMFGLMYFMLIRPENKRKKKDEEMRAAVRNGDEIITIGGICGTIVDIKEDKIVIETSKDQVRIEFAKWALSSNETASARAKEEAKKADEAKAKAKAAKAAEKANKDKV